MSAERPSPRFVVTELEGFLQVGGDTRRARHGRPGLSCQVLDRAYCHRVVAAFRTEEIGGNWGSDGWRRCLACRREGWKRDNARRRKR